MDIRKWFSPDYNEEEAIALRRLEEEAEASATKVAKTAKTATKTAKTATKTATKTAKTEKCGKSEIDPLEKSAYFPKIPDTDTKVEIGEEATAATEEATAATEEPILVKEIKVFTDGSTIHNGTDYSVGGIGIYFSKNNSRNLSKKVIGKSVTNNSCELLAVKVAIESVAEDNNIKKEDKQAATLIIYTDSEYTINCITKWGSNWNKNNWRTAAGKEVKNKELIKCNINLCKKYKVGFIHVKSHQVEPKNREKYKIWYGNKMADYLARKAVQGK